MTNKTMDNVALIQAWVGAGKTYFIQTFGCQLNENDSEKLAGQLEAFGMTKVSEPQDADLYLINTCAIRENASDRFFGHLGQSKSLLKARPEMLIGACGCLMMKETYVDKIKQSFNHLNFLFGPQDLHKLPEILARAIKGEHVYEVGQEDTLIEGLPIARDREHRALVSIMYGCNNFCSYCVVPYARGRERSRDPEAILEEIHALRQEGFNEVMLLGQNVNSYGNDRGGAYGDFADLIERIAQETRMPRIRFMTSHPKDLSPKLLKIMAENPNIERHIHLPLQSGSDRILKAMNRSYDVARYRNIIAEIHQKLPDATVTTDIIVGFPGETEEDFQQTLDLVDEVGFSQAFMFQFSPRPGTPAAKLKEIPKETMTERFNRLLELQNKKSLEAHEAQLGKTVSLLVEGPADRLDGYWAGRDAQNFLVNFTVDPSLLPEASLARYGSGDAALNLENLFVEVQVTDARPFSLRGTLVRVQDPANDESAAASTPEEVVETKRTGIKAEAAEVGREV